ncbi:MAG: DNA-processing protein DprA [Clostridia bacterium]|nr:DNA-processing protein DprA [Clostridia bacterium]
MKDENILYWVWLAERCGPASRELGRLCEKYDDPFDIYRLEEEEIERIDGIGQTLKMKLLDRSLERAYETLRYCKQKNIDIISYRDKRYPSRLRSLCDPPAVLYVLGKLPNMDDRLCIGMVGTRKMSEYGRDTSYKISYELASANAVVVSGMALGVDGVSACGALSAGGTTVAVLGCGLSVVYPKEHERLMGEIIKHGAVITEYPPFEPPHGYNFPKRNRIISGLCQGVLIVEGSSSSGALITAKRAIDQGRELFALPGKINESNSEGPNELIKSGALVALSADDIISHYDFLYHDCINYKGLSKAKSGGMTVERAIAKYGVADIYSRKNSYRTDKSSEKGDGREAVAVPESGEAVSKIKRQTRAKQGERTAPEKVVAAASVEVVASSDRPDCSAEILASLDDVSRRVFEALPMDRAVSPDAIAVDGIGIGDIIMALTMLEISGLAESLPGGMYIRK